MASIIIWFRLFILPELTSYIIKSKNIEGLTFDLLLQKPDSLAVAFNSSEVKVPSRDVLRIELRG
jgi:hypothetical protein